MRDEPTTIGVVDLKHMLSSFWLLNMKRLMTLKQQRKKTSDLWTSALMELS